MSETTTPGAATATVAPAAVEAPASSLPQDAPAAAPSPEPKAGGTLLTADKAAEGGGKTEPAAAEPVTYTDFTIPEGVDKESPVFGKFSEAAAKAGISQAQAQALIDAIGPEMAAVLGEPAKAWNTLNEQWIGEIKADPAYAGAKLDTALIQAGRLFDDFVGPKGSPEREAFIQAMDMTGAGNNPAIFRFIAKVAAEWAPPAPVRGNPPRIAPRNPAAVLYPNAPTRAA